MKNDNLKTVTLWMFALIIFILMLNVRRLQQDAKSDRDNIQQIISILKSQQEINNKLMNQAK